MAFINKYGQNISYECSSMIKILKLDIAEFGGDTIVNVWCKDTHGVIVYTNYDFVDKEYPVTDAELEEGEYIEKMTMSALLILLEQQNEIL